MKHNLYLGFLLILIEMGSCNQSVKFFNSGEKERLWSMVRSPQIDSIIDATIEIQLAKDTSMIKALLYNSNDARVTHRLKYNGMSVYQIKMLSLESITNKKPPKQITYTPDSIIINFYTQTGASR